MLSVAVPYVDVGSVEPTRRSVVRDDEFVASVGLRSADDAPHPELTIDLATARHEADRAVAAFAHALETRDVEALRKAAPAMSARERARWAGVFRTSRSVSAELTVTSVRRDGDLIVASVRSRVDVRLPGSERPVHSDATSVATLVRDSSGWRLRTVP